MSAALLLTDDDGVFDAVSAALAQDDVVRELHRARSLAAARSLLAGDDVTVVLADPRLVDADPAEVGVWLRGLEPPAALLVPHDDATRCVPALGPDLPHHVVTPGAPWQLLATTVRRLIEQHGKEHELAGSATEWRDRLAVVRHEMATPLGAIEGFLEALIRYGERLSADRRRDSLEAAHRNVGRLRRLVTELNAVAKATGPAADTELVLVELGPRLHRLVTDLGPRGDEVLVRVPEGLRGLVDPDHLEAIVDNLIDNAFKYGAPPIEVRAWRRADRVQIGVIDHGEGVPEHFVPHMFERYARAHEVRDRREGSGIGLSLCAELADAIGGVLRYQRGGDGGAVFVLEVMADRQAAEADDVAGAREGVIDIAAIEAQSVERAVAETAHARSSLPAFDALAHEPPAAGDETAGEGAAGEEANGGRATDRQRAIAGELQVVRDGLHTHTTVGLGYAGRAVEGHARGAVSRESRSRAVVRATLDAVECFLDGAATFDVERIQLEGEGDDQHVTVTITATTGDGHERLVGAALVRTDPQRAAMYATLDALNRRIERLLA